MKVSDLPLGKFRDKGIPIDNLSNYDSTQEQILCVAPVQEMKLKKLLFVTAMGMCKLVDGEEFDVAKRTVAATKLLPEDKLVSVGCLEDQGQIVLQSAQGVFLKFALEEIPEKKKAAAVSGASAWRKMTGSSRCICWCRAWMWPSAGRTRSCC